MYFYFLIIFVCILYAEILVISNQTDLIYFGAAFIFVSYQSIKCITIGNLTTKNSAREIFKFPWCTTLLYPNSNICLFNRSV